jgi:hypothetical protein
MKLEGRGSAGEVVAASSDLDEGKFVVLISSYFIWEGRIRGDFGALAGAERFAVSEFSGRARTPGSPHAISESRDNLR